MIPINYDELLGGKEVEPPSIEIVPDAKMQGSTDTMAIDGDEGLSEEFRRMSDKDLRMSLERFRRHLNNPTLLLKDGGVKIKASIRRHENELALRQRLGLQKDDSDGCKKFPTINRSNRSNTSDFYRERNPPQSKFGTCFLKKLDEKAEPRTEKAFDKELSSLNRSQNFKTRPSGNFTSRDTQKRRLSPRETTFQFPGNHSGDIRKNEETNHDKEVRHVSDASADGKVSGGFAKRLRPCLGRSSSKAQNKKAEHVVLVDLEELETMAISTEEDSSEEENTCTKAIIIYYPSRNRDDSEAVEISYSDLKCLAPGKCLSSTIMNFYTRHLQSLTPGRKSCDFHFFNTYFYKKLQDAVMSEGMEETSFAKFRRWWKGVNIFEKAYVLLPIHEDAHWSLVIICIPDEDETGPIILHLDSLGLHSSKAIFSNIKRFLIEEWKILKEDFLSDLYIADKVWENLPQSINTQVMEVPQQRNDYDCGLFVLNSMKKFIEEAPRRVTKKNFPLFGKRWFNPGEASSLRHEIKSLLKERFKKSQEEDAKS